MEFQEPPVAKPLRRYRAERTPILDEITEQLKQRPGEWAKVLVGQKSNSARKAFLRRGAESRSHRHPDGLHDIYARWPG